MSTVPEEVPAERGDELLTITEISQRFEISRQALHVLRSKGVFPEPAPTRGSTRLKWREADVRAYFQAHPKRPGTRTDLRGDSPGD